MVTTAHTSILMGIEEIEMLSPRKWLGILCKLESMPLRKEHAYFLLHCNLYYQDAGQIFANHKYHRIFQKESNPVKKVIGNKMVELLFYSWWCFIYTPKQFEKKVSSTYHVANQKSFYMYFKLLDLLNGHINRVI